MKNIQEYIQKRLKQSTGKEQQSDLLLGSHPASILHFITWKELLLDPLKQLKGVKEMIRNQSVKLVIDGNLSDTFIRLFMEAAVKSKRLFSIVVPDGYKGMRKELDNGDKLAVLIIKHKI
ncbi:hypothetical protein ACYSNR_10080 [Enterococcus sp. LJL128]|uniref:hypothetical protein n=1 Tax=Enterococcus sp. LJL51 TaxID=3416656 RepID=UPI003CF9F5A2